MAKILVTGATGHLGKAVAGFLAKKGDLSEISVLVRSEEKGEEFKSEGFTIKIGDYDDKASLVSAFAGVDKLYFVSGNDIEKRTSQHENVVKAAVEAGVKHVIYTSFQRKNESESSPIAFIANSHLFTEKLLKESGLTYTILQHGLYADIIPLFAGQQLLETKTIYLPAENGQGSFATRIDFAEAGATVLLDSTGAFDNKELELAGSETITWSKIAEDISEITDQKITYVSPSVDEFSATLTSAGVPAQYIGLFSGFAQGIAQGEFENITNDLESILGRKPETVKSYLQTVYGSTVNA